MKDHQHCVSIILTVIVTYAWGQEPVTDIREPRDREAKDLVYEAMKMRTGEWKTWDRNRFEIVGGGIVEKKLLLDGAMPDEDFEGLQHESRGKSNHKQVLNTLYLLSSIPHCIFHPMYSMC